MAKKFITTRELNLIDNWNKELIQSTVEQEIVYWAIAYEESKVNSLYGEAVVKATRKPVKINARVEFEQTATTTGGSVLDSTYSIKVQLHTKECTERNIKPLIGDFIEFGQIVFEITTVGHAEPVFGQINDKLSYQLTCVPSREGQFRADSSTYDNVDNTHPVEAARPRSLGDDL